MKKVLIAFSLILTTICYSQDIIVKVNGDSISSNINEIGINEIKLHKFNNPNGPLYIIDKKDVIKIIFNNGEIEDFVSFNKEKKERNIVEVKEIIIETINTYGYSYSSGKKYIAEFEGNYLKLTPEGNLENRKFTISSYYYDFTAVCHFHKLSERENGVSFVNVYVPLSYKRENEKMQLKKTNNKLVIKVDGHKNGENLREALINYNSFFQED